MNFHKKDLTIGFKHIDNFSVDIVKIPFSDFDKAKQRAAASK